VITDLASSKSILRCLFRVSAYLLLLGTLVVMFAAIYSAAKKGFYSSSINQAASFDNDSKHVLSLINDSFYRYHGRLMNYWFALHSKEGSDGQLFIGNVEFQNLHVVSEDMCDMEVVVQLRIRVNGKYFWQVLPYKFNLYIAKSVNIDVADNGVDCTSYPENYISMKPADDPLTGIPSPPGLPPKLRKSFLNMFMSMIPSMKYGYIQLPDEGGLGDSLLRIIGGAHGEPTTISGRFLRMIIYSLSAATTRGMIGDIVPTTTITKALTALEHVLCVCIYVLIGGEIRRIWKKREDGV